MGGSKERNDWNYQDYLREYLLLIARKGRMALEPIGNFPENIELGKDWHKTLETVRKATLDGKERWALVGVKEERTSLLLSTIPAVGYDAYVPSEVIMKETRRARDEFDIVDVVGDVHSHPRDFMDRLLQRLPALNLLELKACFSAGDYYCMIAPEQLKVFMGVVEGDYNLFMFRTRETRGLGVDPALFNQDSFEKYWYEKYGYKYLGGIRERRADRAIPILGIADPVGMTKAIVERHKLVLYQGKMGKDLRRIYPKL